MRRCRLQDLETDVNDVGMFFAGELDSRTRSEDGFTPHQERGRSGLLHDQVTVISHAA